MPGEKSFDQWVEEALQAHFSGWNFDTIAQRYSESAPAWDYRQIVLAHLGCASLLDLGTGGGEFLSGLPQLPSLTCATEGWLPNLEIAKKQLQPLGVKVSFAENERNLPYPNNHFDLLIDRHESYHPAELFRILKPGGLFITQQVGGKDNFELNQFLAPNIPFPFETWNLESAGRGLRAAGFKILDEKTCRIQYRFHDIGAVVYFLKACEWQIPGFSAAAYRERLLAMHEQIQKQGVFESSGERFLIIAEKS
jgi:SAM-dependent methyltransferase